MLNHATWGPIAELSHAATIEPAEGATCFHVRMTGRWTLWQLHRVPCNVLVESSYLRKHLMLHEEARLRQELWHSRHNHLSGGGRNHGGSQG